MGKVEIKELVKKVHHKDGTIRLNSGEITRKITSLYPNEEVSEEQVEEFLQEQFYDTNEGWYEDLGLEARRLLYLEGR